MRFSKELFAQAISEWRNCYIDYAFLKVFIMLIKDIVQQCQQLQQAVKLYQSSENHIEPKSQQRLIKITKEEVSSATKILQQYKTLAKQLNAIFISAFSNDTQLCALFCKIKYVQIKSRFQMSVAFAQFAPNASKISVLIPYLQYVYIQSNYLKKMAQSNIEGERKILKKHKKYAKKQVFTPQNYLNQKINVKNIEEILNKIQDYYVQMDHKLSSSKKKPKTSRSYIRQLPKKQQVTTNDSFMFGLGIGIIIAVIGFLIFLLIHENKSVETHPLFNRDFATWRGVAFFIIYLWILGVNLYYFEQYMISHRIILDMQERLRSTSTKILKVAGLLSTVFMILFTLYALQLSGLINMGKLPIQYLSLIAWVIFLFYMLNPFPICYYQSRHFAIKIVWRIIISPCLGVSFAVAWATDQLVSLLTPIGDIAYTICYYFKIDFSDIQVKNNNCKTPQNIAQFIYGVVVICYRMIQCGRQGFDKGKYWREPQFYNTIKYLFSLLTLVFSYLYKNSSTNIFAAWVTFAVASTLYSYIWDLKMDWDLLQRKSQHFLLRDKITYAPRFYYTLMILNLILRLAWVLTLSQNITDKLFGSPQIFKLVSGALEIIRRGAWNLVRIQKQHLKNCQNFKAIPLIRDELEIKIKAQIEIHKDKVSNSMERLNQFHLDELVQDIIIMNLKKNTEDTAQDYQLQSYDELRKKISKHEEEKKKWLKIYKQKKKEVAELKKKKKILM